MTAEGANWPGGEDIRKRKRRGRSPAAMSRSCVHQPNRRSTAWFGLRGERQGLDRQLLAGLQGQHVGAFQVGVGQGEAVGAGLQGVDHRVGEGLAVLHDRQVRAERRGLAGHGGERRLQGLQPRVERGVALELGIGRSSDAELELFMPAVLVDWIVSELVEISLKNSFKLVALEQVDAVEARVGRRLVELVLQLVELSDQVGADGVAADRRRCAAAVELAGRRDAADRQRAGRQVGDLQLAGVVRRLDLARRAGVGVDAAAIWSTVSSRGRRWRSRWSW